MSLTSLIHWNESDMWNNTEYSQLQKYLDTIELTLKIPYLESSIILALVIVNPELIMISSNSPILRIPSGLIKASVLGS